jgi:hypothetical protein
MVRVPVGLDDYLRGFVEVPEPEAKEEPVGSGDCIAVGGAVLFEARTLDAVVALEKVAGDMNQKYV